MLIKELYPESCSIPILKSVSYQLAGELMDRESGQARRRHIIADSDS